MFAMRFLGREDELESLKLLLKKRCGSIIACRGRRRIGKSTLIEEFARRNGLRFVSIDGLAPRPHQTNRDQLVNFALKLAKATGYSGAVPQNWVEAFKVLDGEIADDAWTVVLLDEVSWMGRYDPDFAGYLKSAWDEDFKKHDKLILVVCGSVSTWIRKNLLDSSGFGGRFSRDIVLSELPLPLCAKFWGEKTDEVATHDIMDVLAVTGGVPRYLEEVDASLSADENIRRLCFHADGQLFKDFEATFSDVLGDESKMKGDILRMLSERAMTCSEVARRLGQARGGGLSEILNDLCEAGFLAADAGINPETGKNARQGRYRLRDNYTRFFLRYVEPNIEKIRKGQYRFISLGMLPGWDSVLGLAFESLVVNHALQLLPFLHMQGVPITSVAPYVKRGGKTDGGVQVDLMIQTRRSVCLVEIKRKREIGEEVEAEITAKRVRIRIPPDMTVRYGLVYDGELAEVVRGNAFFDAIVSSRDLLGLSPVRECPERS